MSEHAEKEISDLITAVAKAWAQREFDDQYSYLERSIKLCESPIEQRLLIALRDDDCPPFGQPVIGITLESILAGAHHFPHENQWVVLPQAQIGRYRVDFLILVKDDENPHRAILAVECDGHDFHERTKEQAQRDKSRDRYLLSMKIPTMRFTGSEIYQDAEKCASQISQFVEDHAYQHLD